MYERGTGYGTSENFTYDRDIAYNSPVDVEFEDSNS